MSQGIRTACEQVSCGPLTKCVACDGTHLQAWRQKRGPDGTVFRICVCGSCGTGFLNPRPTLEQLRRVYQFSGHGLKQAVSLEQVLRMEKEYPNSTVDAKRLVGVAVHRMGGVRNGRALDVGCGYGFYSAAAIQAGFTVTAVNPGRWENDVFEQLNGFRPVEKYIQEITTEAQYDLIIMSQVLEHIPDLEEVLPRIRQWLAPQGMLALAVPNFDWVLVKLLRERERGCLWVPEHVNYFTRQGVSRLLERFGFSILDYRQISRIPYNAVSRRLRLAAGTRRACNLMVRLLQAPPLRVLDRLGWGLYQNLWATPSGAPSDRVQRRHER
jgi:2-polyprenyl-3-methyl-5-hydroxy-6-metoxy-1,4-benzoquinol methylase